MQVDFYQLSRDPVERVLPAIAARVLDAGGRLLVVDQDAERRGRLSHGLWETAPATFLAHGEAGAGAEAIQPILLAETCQADNSARHVAMTDGIWRDAALAFDRAFYFFGDETVEGARAAWRELGKADGVTPRFWKQDGGRWVQGP